MIGRLGDEAGDRGLPYEYEDKKILLNMNEFQVVIRIGNYKDRSPIWE